jgi:hypothetical protein
MIISASATEAERNEDNNFIFRGENKGKITNVPINAKAEEDEQRIKAFNLLES